MRVIRDPGTRELSVRIGSFETVGQLLNDRAELTDVNATAKRKSIRDKLDKFRFLLRSECRTLSPRTNILSLGFETLNQSFMIDPEVSRTGCH